MTSQEQNDDPSTHKSESRAMWMIAVGGIALILAMMGVGALFNHDTTPTEISSQSTSAPPAEK